MSENQRIGPYRLVRRLGAGAMGEVHLAVDKAGKAVALKILHREFLDDPEFGRRFAREAAAAVELNHPNIARGIVAGEEGGRPWFAMEYCEGRSLDAIVEESGRLPYPKATELVIQIARGLRYAHGRGLIHRDIKPGNVLVTEDGTARILDFGLTRKIRGNQTQLTMTGQALGTPHYLAPEQARGEPGIDGRADIYSLGATYYHLLTGRPPFGGATAFEVVSRHLNDPVPDPTMLCPVLPPVVTEIVRRMMAKRREDRYADCDRLLEDLDRVLHDRPPPRPLSKKLLLIPAALLGAALLVVLVLALRRNSPGSGSKGEVDLLKKVGEYKVAPWYFEGGALVSPNAGTNLGTGSARVGFRADLPEQYDLELVGERREGNEDLIITLPYRGRLYTVAIDGWHGQGRSGLFVNGQWQSRASGMVFVPGRESRIVFAVRHGGLTVTADGRELIRWTDWNQISSPEYTQSGDGVTVGAIRSVYVIRRLVVIPRA